jgi:hypothetical protein
MRKTLMFGAALLVLWGCRAESRNPVESTDVRPSSIICPPGTGMVIRTGADGQPYETCEPYALKADSQ